MAVKVKSGLDPLDLGHAAVFSAVNEADGGQEVKREA